MHTQATPLGRHLVSVLLALLLGPSDLNAQTFQGLGFLPGGFARSVAQGVSADGKVVVGHAYWESTPPEPFRWTATGGMQGLGFLPGFSGGFGVGAEAASRDGAVVVGASYSGPGLEAFRWTATGGMQGLGGLGPAGSWAHRVSDDGAVVVGFSGNEAFRWTPGGGMVGLGDLPGGGFGSIARGVSADGTVVVGLGNSANGGEAFRWTSGGGMVGLGDLPGGSFSSRAYDVSADGATVVGSGTSPVGIEAFRWTAAGGMQALGTLGPPATYALAVSADGNVVVGYGNTNVAFLWTPDEGMRDLRSVLVGLGLNLDGWSLYVAFDVSDDGKVIVGYGRNPQGMEEAWRAELPRLRLLAPAEGALLVAGEPYRIRWQAPAATNFVELTLLPDTLGAAPVNIDLGLPAADTAYVWTVPDTLFSRSARIAILDMENAQLTDTSATFRVKPYHLTRLSADGARYEPFRADRHGWSFPHTQGPPGGYFPPAWFGLSMFDYANGTDPFTDDEYDDDFTTPTINAQPSVFEDWPARVRAFGTDAAYHVIIPGVEAWYRASFKEAWGKAHGGAGWLGSCYGISTSSLLAFSYREAFGVRYPAVGPVEQLITVPMSNPVRELVNTLYAHQDGQVARGVQSARRLDPPRRVLADLKAALAADSTASTLGVLTLKDVTSCAPFAANGGHAVTPYRLERIPGPPGQWRIYIYDPNFPANNNAVVLVDSTLNQWTFPGGPNWGGSCGLFLRDPIANYLQPAIVDPLGSAAPASYRDGGSPLYVAARRGADVVLASPDGSVGHMDGVAFNTLPGAFPDVPDVGGPAPPSGYEVPPGPYTITLTDAQDARLSASVFAPDAIYTYGRADADTTHTDLLRYDPDAGLGGGLTARSDDTGATKRITLRAILNGSPERTFDADDLALTGVDSVRFAAVADAAGPRLRVENPGAAKTYTLRLRQADDVGGARFRHTGVPLAARATHTVRPDWATLGGGPVEVDVDFNGDGVPDEVLVLEPHPVGAEPDVPLGSPQVFALHPPSPNPFAGRVTFIYDVPVATHLRLAVYDLLGREVAVLMDGFHPAGKHSAALDGSGLPSGTYLVLMTTPDGFVQSRRVTRLR